MHDAVDDSATLHTRVRHLIALPDLDTRILADPLLAHPTIDRLRTHGAIAWSESAHAPPQSVERARYELHRALYELNRLNLYWFDDPGLYANERSTVLSFLRDLLEEPWQEWLLAQLPASPSAHEDPAAALRSWASVDGVASDTPDQRWFADEMTLDGYRRLLEIVSLNGLVEASQLSRALGGAPSPIQSTLTRIFLEEYGAGRPAKKHSTFFAQMLEEQRMNATPEGYVDDVPWETLAAINHSFYLAENKRHYLRFCGAFTYTEVSTPASFDGYARAARRLGVSDGHSDYWSLHIREDTRHGAWMVDEVAAPLCERFPERRSEVLLGYQQQRLVEGLAGAATARECRRAVERGRQRWAS